MYGTNPNRNHRDANSIALWRLGLGLVLISIVLGLLLGGLPDISLMVDCNQL